MFGPESGKNSWKDLTFVYDKVRIGNEESRVTRCDNFLKCFEREGCLMREMTCAEHDMHAAESQFITHTVGRILEKFGLDSTPINTKGYGSLLDLLERLDLAFESLKKELFGKLHEALRKQMFGTKEQGLLKLPLNGNGTSLPSESDSSIPRSHVGTHFPATIITIILSYLAFCSSSLPLLLVIFFYLLSFSFLLLANRFLLVDSCLPTLACRLLLADSCLSTLAYRLVLVDSCFLNIVSCLLLATNTKLSTCYGFVLPVPLSASLFSFLLAQGNWKPLLHKTRFLAASALQRRATPLS
ncbi:hypothetical protein Tco_1367694 [Tanacetum coccineum]